MASEKTTITASEVLKGDSPLVLVATLEPIAGQDRFQPAGFPEIGHVIYKAPRANGISEQICIVDSPASMANHLESVCMYGPHDLDLVDDLAGMPHLRCVTEEGWPKAAESPSASKKEKTKNEVLGKTEVVVTSLTEGHRIASTYFLGGNRVQKNGTPVDQTFEDELVDEIGIVLKGSTKAHPPAARWWNVFKTIFKYDPNALVHGVMFPQWQVKIARVLTANLEAFGAGRVDRSGVKFDRLGKTTSGQPIFAVDDAVADEIRATFVLDSALVRSFGRGDLGLGDEQKELLVSLALWKIDRLLSAPFRFRSGCHLRCVSLRMGNAGEVEMRSEDGGGCEVQIDVNMKDAIRAATFRKSKEDESPVVTDIYWPAEALYREPTAGENKNAANELSAPSDDENNGGDQ